MLPTDKVKVFTYLPKETILEPYSTIYEDRQPSLPWQTEDVELIARMAWAEFSPHSGVAVLGAVKHYFGHPVRVIQWWRIPEDITVQIDEKDCLSVIDKGGLKVNPE